MALGDKISVSPVVQAIQEVDRDTTGEIRVHLSQRWLEPDAFRRAKRIFQLHQMNQTSLRNAVLIYVNLRKRKFAIVGDFAIDEAVGRGFWQQQALKLEENLNSTQSERAIALAVTEIGEALKRHLPTSTDLG